MPSRLLEVMTLQKSPYLQYTAIYILYPKVPFTITFTVRFQEQIDQSSTVKFVYIHWIGKQVPFTMKGRYGIVHGSVKKSFEVNFVC